MKKRFIPALAGLCLSTASLLFAPALDAQVIKAADVHPQGYPNVVAVQNMGEKLKQQTNGELEIKTFPGGVLGDEKQMIEQAQMGAIDMIRVSMAPVAAILPEIEVFTLPYVFRDEDHMHKVIDGDIGKQIGDKLTSNPKSRLVFLGWMDSGTRNLITKNPVVKPDDLKGMKIRVQGSPVAIGTLKAMGANAVAMGVSEVYSGLQTGVIDGAENNPPTYIAHNYLPVAKHYTLSGHFIIPEMLLYSKVKWDKLKPEQQQKILTLAREAQMEQRELWNAYNKQALDKMKAGGVQFHDIDKAFFVNATAPVRDQYGAKHQDLMKAIADVK
ncbi:TPA: TRAP transporter substrate-binding protein [Cronobacter sakazakii]|uniref:TRAP transporter substrate-binding protein n=1 Tax=Cronobacter sakazakii TaxID=28141 RepID=UPI0004A94EF7|nr:TRAP transporter substrate-binding protein [Cronobacter sakazakii]EGT5206578.1 TRAP transporter substrate-binding protein [Cronobacter sakazakii]EGT5651548.1 TRAP transporter substrate-binding protein [Cronobacter sakazakii]EGT5748932.1 TRAP transporter substrate-binding protein [Cronobacter sakazakii]EGT5752534.1 TRAP transporter substrate-binding protein [Cronobacter sakazakii]EIZ2183037.1 TRAP transporter substrate-binding protein [Cronobacter sakazakii]